MRSSLTLGLLGLSFFVGCADPAPTRVLAIVDAESLVRDSTREVEVAVWGGEDAPPDEEAVPLEELFVMRRSPGDAGFDWPLRILLRPRDGKDRTYRIRVRAYDAAGGTARPPDSFVAETRAVNRYARGDVRELRLLLLNECIGQMCEQNQRCVARGLCETLQEDPLVPVADAGISESDAGPDAGPPECSRPADCDDDDPCTDDACIEGRCERTNNTASCNDGLFCTTNDVCNAGVCAGGDDPCGGLECDDTADACVGCTDSCPDVVGEWGECSFADDCATTGTQTRSVSSATCSGGTCMASGAPRTEMQACTRMDTGGQLCGDPTEMPGACMPSSGGCGTLPGNRTIVVTQPTCGGGTCGAVTSSRTEGCTVTVPCSDAGLPDGGVDAGSDAGSDAGRDAGFDAGNDAGADSGPVVTLDSGLSLSCDDCTGPGCEGDSCTTCGGGDCVCRAGSCEVR